MLFLVALLALTVVSTCTGENWRKKRNVPSDPLITYNLVIEKFNEVNENIARLGNQLNSIETKMETTCPSGYVGNYVSGCYKFFSSATNYDSAKTDCEGDGAHLLAVETAGEMTKVTELMDRVNAEHGWYRAGGKKVGGSWKWEGVNTHFTYTNWQPGEPSSESDAVCMEFYYEPGAMAHKMWDAYRCTEDKYYICEM